jgi:MFS family permease
VTETKTRRRWCFYIVIIWAGLALFLIVVFVPETYGKVLLQKATMDLEKGQPATAAAIRQAIVRSCYRPFQLLTLEPMVLCLCLYSALLLAILYLFFGAFALVFKKTYGFNLWETGLTFLGMGCGMAIAIATDKLWLKNYLRLLKKAGGHAQPEMRLPPLMAGSILATISLFWFAFTAYSSVHWIVPIIGSGIYALG